jgi:hypothetical protein
MTRRRQVIQIKVNLRFCRPLPASSASRCPLRQPWFRLFPIGLAPGHSSLGPALRSAPCWDRSRRCATPGAYSHGRCRCPGPTAPSLHHRKHHLASAAEAGAAPGRGVRGSGVRQAGPQEQAVRSDDRLGRRRLALRYQSQSAPQSIVVAGSNSMDGLYTIWSTLSEASINSWKRSGRGSTFTGPFAYIGRVRRRGGVVTALFLQ